MGSVQKIDSDSNVIIPPWAMTTFAALDDCTPAQAGRRRELLPYSVQPMASMPERAIVLGRRYKPLGLDTRAWVDYGAHPEAHVHIELYRMVKPIHLNAEDCFYTEYSDAPWLSTRYLQEYRAKIQFLLTPWLPANTWS